MDAWTRGLGTTQGRIAASAPEGSFVFELGSSEAGAFQAFNIGDYSEVSQAADLTGLALLRATALLRPPAVATPGCAWKYRLLVDGVERASQVLVPGHPRRRADLAANVAWMGGGVHTIAFRLELVAA